MSTSLAIPPLTKTMKTLLGIMAGSWLALQLVAERWLQIPVTEYLGLVPSKVLFSGFLWQVFTYIFLHSLDISHLVLNLLMTWLIGSDLEKLWGSKRFVFYYLGSGVGAGILYTVSLFLWFLITNSSLSLMIPVIGSSGAVFGLILAYGLLLGNRTIHFMLLFPMKAKTFALILGVMEVLSLLSKGTSESPIAHLAHLGGLVSGFLILLGLASHKQYSRTLGLSKTHILPFFSKKKGLKKINLKLIVDNEKTQDSSEKKNSHNSDGKPRYWN
jgi:membrane associated rhomboid family serine protease